MTQPPRPVSHPDPARAVRAGPDRRDVDAGPSEASEVQAGRLVQVPVADIPPGGGRPDMEHDHRIYDDWSYEDGCPVPPLPSVHPVFGPVTAPEPLHMNPTVASQAASG